MQEATAPRGPARRSVLVPRSTSAGAIQLQLRAPGAPQKARCRRRAAPKPQSRRLPPIPSTGQG
eukprot:3596623-Alexandrium_andersonii.AAC.1